MNQQEAEEFVRVWQTSNSRAEVMERLSLEPRQVDGRAYRLRKQGVPLKTYSATHKLLDVDRLKRLAQELAAREQATP